MFMEDIASGSLDMMINKIPDDTNVLITHQPPYGYCDEFNQTHCGDRILCKKVDALSSLRYHLFGHQHDANSVVIEGNKTFSNAAISDCNYNMVAEPRLFLLK